MYDTTVDYDVRISLQIHDRSRSTDEYAKTIEGAIYNLLSYTVESSSNDIVLYLTSGKRFQILDDEPVI